METEFKLLVDRPLSEDDLRSALGACGVAVEAAESRAQHDVYLDSARRDLTRAGAALRVRRHGERAWLTFKAEGGAGGAGGLTRRVEDEQPWAGQGLPERGDALPELLRHRVEPLVYARELAPIAELRTERLVVPVRLDGVPAELALDRVEGEPAAGAPRRFGELEIELADDAPGAWPDVVTALRERLDLREGGASKLERVLGDTVAREPPPVPLERRMPFAQAAREVFRRHLLRLRREEPGTRLREHIERLHKMRVATRRLRASFRTLGGAFRPGELEPWDRLMRRTGGALGPARDLDVLLEALPGLLAGLPDAVREDLEPFVRLVEQRRDREQVALLRWLQARRRLAATARLQQWLDADLPEPGRRALRVDEVAPGLVLRAARRALRRGAAIGADTPPERLHALRIAMKRLRYTLEPFTPLYPELDRFVEASKELQDVLGAFNDAAVQQHLVAELVDRYGRRLRRPTVMAVGALLGAIASRGEQARAHFEAAWSAFDRKRNRRALALALAQL
jgi:CHAD domain-containing protein